MKVGDHIKVKRAKWAKKRAKRSLTFFGSDHMSGFFLPNFIGSHQNWAKRSLGKKSVSTERPYILS